MVLHQKLTPETFVSAPRRSPAVPAPSGRVAFFTVSTHVLSDDVAKTKGKTTRKLCLMDLGTGEYWPFAAAGTPDDVAKIGDIAWVPGRDELLWLREVGGNDNSESDDEPITSTEVVVAAATWSPDDTSTARVVGRVAAPISGLKLKALPDGTIAFAVAGLVAPDGSLYGGPPMPERAAHGRSSARIYDTWQVRQWDAYRKPHKYSIWYACLERCDGTDWRLGTLFNALAYADNIDEAPYDMYEAANPADAYDISAQGLLFVAQAQAPAARLAANNPLLVGCTDVYYMPLASFAAPPPPPPSAACKPTRIRLTESPPSWAPMPSSLVSPFDADAGMCSNPRFAPDGKSLAFLRAPLACPADTRLYMGHIVWGAVDDVLRTAIGGPSADDTLPPPDSFEFAPAGVDDDAAAVFVVASDCGRRSLFVLDLKEGARARTVSAKPGSVVDYHVIKRTSGPADCLSSYSVLLSGSSFVESSYYHMIDLADSDLEPCVVSTATRDGSTFGLSYKEQVSEMYVESGGGEYVVQAWVVRPRPNANPNPELNSDGAAAAAPQKHPLALFIHGGPEDAYNDEWHGRWNAALWAAQGYVVVLPNFSGSHGFGVAHQARIYGSWGGRPYNDLVNVMEGLKSVPDIDCDRAVVCGASYGGYMVNYMLSSALGKQFRAAVTHDSVFSTTAMALNSDVSDGISSFEGSSFPWDNFKNLDRWNPSRPDRLARWRDHAPPTLVIHSDRDFRCPITDGLAVFRALQFQGVPSRFLTFPDENHFISNPENMVVWLHVILDWTNRWRDVPRVG